jgi:REP element-mobilizing transposase RayT
MSRAHLLTWTTYGSWLPGDVRGSVTTVRDEPGPRRRHNVPGTPYDPAMSGLNAAARAALRGPVVFLDKEQADCLVGQFQETANARGWRLLAAAVMRNHVHLVIVADDGIEPATMLRDFKSYGSRKLNLRWPRPASGTWWTESGSRRRLPDENAIRAAVRYVERQQFSLVV